MAAGKGPTGPIPDKSGDVKQSTESSEVENAQKAAAAANADSSKEDSDDVDENDLKSMEEERKVPYQRFKEVNDKAKRAAVEKDDLERRYQDEIRRVLIENEALKSARTKPQEDVLDIPDPATEQNKLLAQQIQELKTAIGSLQGQTLTQQLERLKTEFPDADEIAALGIKKHNPNADLREVMELLQNKVNERAEAKLKAIIEQKKAKAKLSPALAETGFKFTTKEKPKTVKEANAILKRLMSSG